MSDTGPWQSPSGADPSGATPPAPGATPPPPPPVQPVAPGPFAPPPGYAGPPPGYIPPPPGYAAPPPGYAAPPPGYAGPPPGYAGPPPGWAPPPKPGLIPIAPLGLGTILGASFRVLRRNPRPAIAASLVVHVLITAIAVAAQVFFTQNALKNYLGALTTIQNTGDASSSSLGAIFGGLLTAQGIDLLVAIFDYGISILLFGFITVEVTRAALGEKLPFGAIWSRLRPRLGALFGWAGLVILVLVVAFGIVVGGIFLLFTSGGTAGAVVGFVLLLAASAGGVVLVAWLWTKLGFVSNALVAERLTIRGAMRRSWSLTRGFFWRTFGIKLLVGLIVSVVSSIIELPVAFIFEIVIISSHPTSAQAALQASGTETLQVVITGVVSAIVATIIGIVPAATDALLYLDLRIRKEGLDLSLVRYVDARTDGRRDLPDPYLTADSITAPTPNGADRAA